MPDAGKPVPLEIGRAGRWDVKIRWSDGRESVYPARALRLACSCAGCRDELSGTVRIREEDVAADVHPEAIRPVGRYGIHVRWSDGHGTGIYTFDYLRSLEL
jgi:ATP-binding protein involved in chromosome partitioning